MIQKFSISSKLNSSLSRRSLFKGATVGFVGSGAIGYAKKSTAEEKSSIGVRNGKINQSVVSWCFSDYWSVEETCRQATRLGCKSIELINSKHWPV